MEPLQGKEYLNHLTKRFRGLRAWEYYSISKLKNSMYCPYFMYYLYTGVKQKKIVTPEGRQGSEIHEKLDVTEKIDAEPWEAAVYNIYAILEALYNSYHSKRSTLLTELPYFSPQRKIFGYPDMLLIHGRDPIHIEIIERKTRMRRTGRDDLPYIFIDDIFQLYIQKKLIKDIITFSIKQGRKLPAIEINPYIELRRRDVYHEKPSVRDYRELLENTLPNLPRKNKKTLRDNYQKEFTARMLFNEPSREEEPLYCWIDLSTDMLRERFNYVEGVLLMHSKPDNPSGPTCSGARRRYCGYAHLCSDREEQMNLDRFTST